MTPPTVLPPAAKLPPKPKVFVIIPAFNEADSIEKVISDIPEEFVAEVIVVNNGSTDTTEHNARRAGATVLREARKGYGFACLKGIEYASVQTPPPDIVVFLDGDYSDFPGEIVSLVRPIEYGEADLVIGSRVLGKRLGKMESGAMLPQAVFGNALATTLIRLFYGVRFTDLGPFRAIGFSALQRMKMRDTTFGWTVEMQVKAAKLGLRCLEVPVSYRQRVGVSKITGTVSGTIKAGYKILYTIFRLLLTSR